MTAKLYNKLIKNLLTKKILCNIIFFDIEKGCDEDSNLAFVKAEASCGRCERSVSSGKMNITSELPAERQQVSGDVG